MSMRTPTLPAAGQAALLDSDPAAVGTVLFLGTAFAGMAFEAAAQPLFLVADTVEIGAPVKAEPQHVPEGHAGLHHAFKLRIELDVSAVPQDEPILGIEYSDTFPHGREVAAQESLIFFDLPTLFFDRAVRGGHRGPEIVPGLG